MTPDVSSPRVAFRIIVLLTAACVSACAGSVRPTLSPRKPKTDALLILPGLGYNHAAEQTFRSVAASVSTQGVDVYVADYLTRGGLYQSRDRLRRFIDKNDLAQYQRVHVFAFLAGAWTFNVVADTARLPNLATVVFDRSPLQERAPRIAADHLRVVAWLRYGNILFDLARLPYPPFTDEKVKVGLLIETKPTSFIRDHAAAARAYGPLAFGCSSLSQRYQDCIYVPMNHNELYQRFPEVLPELLAFIRSGRFTVGANRQPPAGDVLAPHRQ
jgi:hypothetical protein